jgi:hypothetical protein
MGDIVMMVFGIVVSSVGAIAVRSVTQDATKRSEALLRHLNVRLKETGTVDNGFDFIAGLPTAALGRVRLLRPKAAQGRLLRRYRPEGYGEEGIINIAAGIDGVIAEVVIDGVAALRQAAIRIAPSSTVGDAYAPQMRSVSTGVGAFDMAYAVHTDAKDVVQILARETDLLDIARDVLTNGGVVIDGAAGVLRVVAALPLNADAIDTLAAQSLRLAKTLNIPVRSMRLGVGAVGGTSGSPFALPSG